MLKILIFDAFILLICEKNVANYAFLRRKTFSLKIWLCKIFDKYHVWLRDGIYTWDVVQIKISSLSKLLNHNSQIFKTNFDPQLPLFPRHMLLLDAFMRVFCGSFNYHGWSDISHFPTLDKKCFNMWRCPIKQHHKFLCEKIISQPWLVQKPFLFHPDIVQPKY